MKKLVSVPIVLIILLFVGSSFAADVVPPVVTMPGTQPNEVQNLESPNKCDNCHGGYDSAVYSNEPAFGWRGSAMGNAGRDPIFWATLAIAEQDFDGAGDLCIRCHSSGGWIAGRSTPTDGSGLQAADDDGVDCDTCHKATNPDNSEWLGVMNQGFVANDSQTVGQQGEGFYGSGILSIWGGSDKLGPYSDAQARHQWMASRFHRGTDPSTNVTTEDNICGSCHDVSNGVVGTVAPNSGTQPWSDPIVPAGTNPSVAFTNPPYKYGIVERTYSEWRSSILDTTPVIDFPGFPPELQAQSGALNMAYQSALLAGSDGTYQDGTVRTFTCMGCHMRADIGEGCNKPVPTRPDLPKHDLTGGNYWVWPLIQYQDQQGTLRLGGGLTATQLAAMDAGQIRGEDQLKMAASLEVIGDTVKITNLTGHKLITGYPEGRRMWLNIKWYDANGNLLREDGKYGSLQLAYDITGDGINDTVETILDLDGTNTRIYEAHYAITKDWAATVEALHGPDFPLSFDRVTGDVDCTVSQFISGACGTSLDYHETFHFVLNNTVAKDNRIPPYGMDCEEARVRNALPVPPDQFGGPADLQPGGACSNVTFNHWDIVTINPPTVAQGYSADATSADITLYYQGTSWEYVQFLDKANNGQNAFLGQEGVNMLDAWLNAVDKNGNTMVRPFAMATATWGTVTCAPVTEGPYGDSTCSDIKDNDCDGLIDANDPDCEPPTMACADYPDKGSCTNDPNCEWAGSPKAGSCQDAAVCVPTSPDEGGLCADGIDNDCDGLTDCADTNDCGADPICQVDCSVYSTRNLCNAQSACSWDNKNKICVNL